MFDTVTFTGKDTMKRAFVALATSLVAASVVLRPVTVQAQSPGCVESVTLRFDLGLGEAFGDFGFGATQLTVDEPTSTVARFSGWGGFPMRSERDNVLSTGTCVTRLSSGVLVGLAGSFSGVAGAFVPAEDPSVVFFVNPLVTPVFEGQAFEDLFGFAESSLVSDLLLANMLGAPGRDDAVNRVIDFSRALDRRSAFFSCPNPALVFCQPGEFDGYGNAWFDFDGQGVAEFDILMFTNGVKLGSGTATANFSTVVPEPSSFLLVLAGLGAVLVSTRRVRSQVRPDSRT